ncbi:hypothetical protein [Novosphingobium sp.]|uniref:hypothetical protein n=1 Tax=Novosphingobium sp. TaxID=1874826 RepID=UPI003B5234B6
MADMITPDLLPGIGGSVVKKRLVDMGDGTFAEMTVATLAASGNAVGTVNLGSLGGAATAANQTLGNASLSALSAPYAAATSTPIRVTVSDTVAHMLGPFTPQLSREIWLTINATTTTTGTAQLLRSTDAGATRIGLTAGGVPIGAFVFAAVSGAIVNEILTVETDAAATYFLSLTLTAGTVAVRIAQ